MEMKLFLKDLLPFGQLLHYGVCSLCNQLLPQCIVDLF